MFFDKKTKCKLCGSKMKEEFSYCPYCGHHLLSKEEEMREFGMLGKNDSTREPIEDQFPNLGLTDKLINSLMSNLLKNINNQAKEVSNDENTEVTQFPNGIRIKINTSPMRKVKKVEQKQPQRKISEEQLKKLSEFPREIAKSKVRRLSDKVVYELSASGVESPNDIFFSKLESGYEIKAIGKKKIYVNSLPVELPLRGFAIDKDKILVEFKLNE